MDCWGYTMTVIQQLSPDQAVEHALHFRFPKRHCQRMIQGLKWNQHQRAVINTACPLLHSGGIVLIHGIRGNGKTQIGAGLGCQWWKRGYHIQRGKARYWTLPDLFAERELRELIDTRYREDQKPTLLLTNVKPNGLRDALDYSILDRIRENGAILQLWGTSYRGYNPDQ